MDPKHEDYKGHRIELRPRIAERPRALGAEHEELGLLIDDQPVRYGQRLNGEYFLHEYAYDPSNDLMDLAKKFIDYLDRVDKIRRQATGGQRR